MEHNELTEEQKTQFREAKTPEEILEVAQKHGIELSIDELDGAAGGRSWSDCDRDTNSGPY